MSLDRVASVLGENIFLIMQGKKNEFEIMNFPQPSKKGVMQLLKANEQGLYSLTQSRCQLQ